MGEKIDLCFPAGFHTLLLGNTRYRISVSQSYGFKKSKVIDLLMGITSNPYDSPALYMLCISA